MMEEGSVSMNRRCVVSLPFASLVQPVNGKTMEGKERWGQRKSLLWLALLHPLSLLYEIIKMLSQFFAFFCFHFIWAFGHWGFAWCCCFMGIVIVMVSRWIHICCCYSCKQWHYVALWILIWLSCLFPWFLPVSWIVSDFVRWLCTIVSLAVSSNFVETYGGSLWT